MRENKENRSPEIIHLKEVLSTNISLREMNESRSLPEGSVIWADAQTAGRGQLGNTWESETGKNLTFSVVLYPDVIRANQQFLVSQIAALSVKETLELYTGDIRIKWPNDIYCGDRKICGMLIENDLAGATIFSSIIGIGINLNQQHFSPKALNPVSLTQITGDMYDREEVLHQFLSRFYSYYLLLLQEKGDEIQSAYFDSLYRGIGFYTYQDDNGVFEAEIKGIEPTGHLLLRLREGSIRRYAFKEVSYMIT